jgi:hypothetical protein
MAQRAIRFSETTDKAVRAHRPSNRGIAPQIRNSLVFTPSGNLRGIARIGNLIFYLNKRRRWTT